MWSGVHPIWFTVLALITGLVASISIALGLKVSAIVFLLLSGYFDTVDGTVARMAQKSTKIGTVLDIVSDRIVEFGVVVALFHLYGHPYLALFMLGSMLICITSFLVVSLFLDEKTEKSFSYSRGLIERPEAFVFFGFMILFPKLYSILAITFAILVFLTAFLRIKEFSSKTL